MDTIQINKGNVKMVAHRGLSGLEKENTAAAFVAAGNRSHYGVETDIHMTRDGKIVTIHDSSTERVAGVKKIAEKARLSTLRKIVMPDHIDGEPRWDLRIPTLEEYLRICKKYEKQCVLEIKGEFTPVQLSKVVDTVEAVYDLARVTFISFKMENLIALRAMLPQQPMQFLTSTYKPEHMAALDKYNFDLDVNHKCVTKALVDEIHAHGHELNVWTVDEAARAQELAAWGVDYITTNILE